MDEIICYIFSRLNGTETTLKAIYKTLRKQRSFNRNTIFLMAMMTTCLAIQEIEICNMYHKIENLEGELRKMKGD